MWDRIKRSYNAFKNPPIPVAPTIPEKSRVIRRSASMEIKITLEEALRTHIRRSAKDDLSPSLRTNKFAMDSAIECEKSLERHSFDSAIKPFLTGAAGFSTISEAQLAWYSSQGFIGYQIAALLSQQWLINRCCRLPAGDAVRPGFEISVNDGTKLDSDILNAIREADLKYRLNENLVQFEESCRVYGVRVLYFKVESDDPEYYEKPFNIDGVTPGSYKGMVQVDPYWMTPELDADAAGNPASMFFYEPTWWRVNNQRIHRTHIIIARTTEVSDILKPTYFYGGIPIPQLILDRVYGAERTANEAPQLAMTKRLTILKTDMAAALANESDFFERLNFFAKVRDNYGTRAIDNADEMEQFDTSLADLDSVIMTGYQLVAAASGVPATKILGTTPKGFNATGEYDERSYHETLETIQMSHLTPVIERHHDLIIKSEILPDMPFSTKITWNKVSTLNDEQVAAINEAKSRTGQNLITSGAIDAEEERNRIINDPHSGYNGIGDTDQSEIDTPPVASAEIDDPEKAGKNEWNIVNMFKQNDLT